MRIQLTSTFVTVGPVQLEIGSGVRFVLNRCLEVRVAKALDCVVIRCTPLQTPRRAVSQSFPVITDSEFGIETETEHEFDTDAYDALRGLA